MEDLLDASEHIKRAYKKAIADTIHRMCHAHSLFARQQRKAQRPADPMKYKDEMEVKMT